MASPSLAHPSCFIVTVLASPEPLDLLPELRPPFVDGKRSRNDRRPTAACCISMLNLWGETASPAPASSGVCRPSALDPPRRLPLPSRDAIGSPNRLFPAAERFDTRVDRATRETRSACLSASTR